MNSDQPSQPSEPSAPEPFRSKARRILNMRVISLEWLGKWHFWRRVLFTIACLATLLGLFHAEEDIRGRMAWTRYRKQLKAEGKWLETNQFIPAPVPDAQNFAATPRLADLFDYLPSTNGQRGRLRNTNAYDNAQPPRSAMDGNGSWAVNKPTDFRACLLDSQEREASRKYPDFNRQKRLKGERFFADIPDTEAEAAARVLQEMAKLSDYFDEFSSASKRPYSRFPLDYDNESKFAILLPHLAAIKRATGVFSVKACAELAVGQVDKAFDDTMTSLRIAETPKTEPFLISQLVRIASINLALQPVWEGMGRHQWAAAQLDAFQSFLEPIELNSQARVWLHAELWSTESEINVLKKRPRELVELFSEIGTLDGAPAPEKFSLPPNWIIHLAIPSGWGDFEMKTDARLMYERIAPILCLDTGIIKPEITATNDDALIAELGSFHSRILGHRIIAAGMLPGVMRVSVKYAYARAVLDLATVGCALERHYIDKGHYPEKLDALSPVYLKKIPFDVINGQPLKYRLTDGGRYVLYSVGWNGTDDGGSMVVDRPKGDHSSGYTGRWQRDWVWQPGGAAK